VPADTSTYSSIAVHQSIRGDIQSTIDHDWHRILLQAGQTYRFEAIGNGVGNTIIDPTLTLRDALGRQLRFNDDFGGSRNAHIDFTASSSGTFYLDVGGATGRTGSYTLTA
jgi:serralysin